MVSEDAELADDEGPVLRVVYFSATRRGRRKNHLDIPIPDRKTDEALRLVDFYKSQGGILPAGTVP